jgi:hypothetical protein
VTAEAAEFRSAIGNRTFKSRLNRDGLRFAPTRAYMLGMDRIYWQRKLQEAEAELDAATRRSDVDAAARKLQYAKARLKALEAETVKPPKRPAINDSRSAAASS